MYREHRHHGQISSADWLLLMILAFIEFTEGLGETGDVHHVSSFSEGDARGCGKGLEPHASSRCSVRQSSTCDVVRPAASTNR
jgi:hypothetical protein